MANKIETHYVDMPEYNNVKEDSHEIEVLIKFRSREDFEMFNGYLKEFVYKTNKVFDGMQKKDKKYAWFPLKEKASNYYFGEE